MQSWFTSLSDRLTDRSALRRWSRVARDVGGVDTPTLRQLRVRARELRQRLDQVLFTADSRLALPLLGSNTIKTPLHTDWSHRPQAWRGPLKPSGVASIQNGTPFGDEVKLFHDCPLSEVAVRQVRNTRESDLAPFGVTLEVFGFQGSFLSMAIELPDSTTDGLHRNHIVRLSVSSEAEKPIDVFARLNIQYGPNHEQLPNRQTLENGAAEFDFDLAYSNMNEKRVQKMWVDLVCGHPEMNRVTLRDLTLCRFPRAEI